ncbi:MAG TPA: APC family permease [Bryobacterales bacterium]|nr:APC family permease [Bryobacterales bacterium]
MNERHSGELHRALGLGALTIYGIGDILGAGIYALIGKVAAVSGHQSWISFAGALFVAALTALSYAELVGRYPRSGSESYFVRQAFPSPALGLFVGWLVFCSGVVSTATVSHAFSGYFASLVPGAPAVGLIVVFLLLISAINYLGIRQSSSVNMFCTAVEVSGLALVLYAGWSYLGGDAARELSPSDSSVSWPDLAEGSVLAFYAFIGFEDMVNIAEEVKSPRKTLPRAIVTALIVAGSLYMLVSGMATTVVPVDVLAASEAPLLEVVRRGAPAIPPTLFTVIALLAVANTGLLNFVTGSRLLYGMSRQGLLPPWLGAVHSTRRTPHHAIVAILLVTLLLALSGTLVFLAGTTSFLLLTVFFAVNSSLVVIKLKTKPEPVPDTFQVPLPIPAAGAVSALGLLFFVPLRALLTAAILSILGLAVVLARKSRPADQT